MIRLAAFAASSALLLAAATTTSALNSEANSPLPSISSCAIAEANAAQGGCTPNLPGGAPISPTETVLAGACFGGDLHVVRYTGPNGDTVVGTWCALSR